MYFQIDTAIACSAERLAAEVKKPELLRYVAHPLIEFEPTNSTIVPLTWDEQTYWFRMKLFGFIPIGEQAIRITYPVTRFRFEMQDNGNSPLIRRWHHTICITDDNAGCCYRDSLQLDAGLLTPLVWLFARVFFGHRQARLRRLALTGFDYRSR